MKAIRDSASKWLPFLCLAIVSVSPLNSSADGCFVAPKFVWDKHKDINEPTQKAIIVYDAGKEDLILQVKYEGPTDEFGWLVPVPNLPEVKLGSMKCFYELSQYTQKHFEPESKWPYHKWEFPVQGVAQGMSQQIQEPPVKVVEVKTVGDYKIAVVSTQDSKALTKWLKKNRYFVPLNKTNVLDYYAKQHWYFVAVKIQLPKSVDNKALVASQLASGELNPLQITFASDKCVFPLKISSLNGQPSEVQTYVLSPEPLLETGMLEQKLPAIYSNDVAQANRVVEWQRTNTFPRRIFPPEPSGGNLWGELALEQYKEYVEETRLPDATSFELILYAKLTKKDLPDFTKLVPRLAEKPWWLSKQTWNFKPEEMRDLVFEPAIPYFSSQLASKYGYFAAAELAGFETDSVPFVIAAFHSPNPMIRTNAILALNNPKHRIADPRLTQAALSWLKDSEPKVREEAVEILTEETNWDSGFALALLPLLRDDDAGVRRNAVLRMSKFYNDLQKFIPEFHKMLQDTNVDIRLAGLDMLFWTQTPTNLWLHPPISRDEFAQFFEMPNRDVIGFLRCWIQRKPDWPDFSNEHAVPLLRNPDPIARLIGLGILNRNANHQSIELALPLLKDSDEDVRTRAAENLHALTGQNFDHLADWEKWWNKNKTDFVVRADR